MPTPLEIIRHRELWTYAECAVVWGYPVAFFKDLVARDEIDAVRPDDRKRVKVTAASVRAYFERKRVTTAQPAKKLTIRQQAALDPRVMAARAARGL